MSDKLLLGLGFMLLIEGLLPFLSPGSWRNVFSRVLTMSDGQLRFMGLASMVAGLVILFVIVD